MTALIDDELVEMVARAICPTAADGKPIKSRMPGAMYDARAALAVAVPVIVERCHGDLMRQAEIRRELALDRACSDDVRRKLNQIGSSIETAAADMLRSLTKVQP